LFNIEHISPSELDMWQTCPRRWLYRREGRTAIIVDDRDRLFGQRVHELIAEYFREMAKRTYQPTEDDITEVATKVFENYGLNFYKNRLEKIRDNFIEFEKARRRKWKTYLSPNVKIEFRLESKPPNAPTKLVGVIDFYLREEETLIDWKTGGNPFRTSYAIQGKMYEMLLRYNGYPVRNIMFVNLLTNECLPSPRVSDGWIYKLINSMLENVRLGRFPALKTGFCDYCEYRLDCEFSGSCWLMEGYI